MTKTPFEKLNQARERDQEITDTHELETKGRGGPIVDEMMQMAKKLGLEVPTDSSEESRDKEKAHNIREMMERKNKAKILDRYNFLAGEKSKLQEETGDDKAFKKKYGQLKRHEDFEKTVLEGQEYGFNLYLKAFVRHDTGYALRPFESYKVEDSRGSHEHVRDDNNETYYKRRYLADGVEAEVNVHPEDKLLLRIGNEAENGGRAVDETFEGYTDKYQVVGGLHEAKESRNRIEQAEQEEKVEKSRDKAAMESYMFEKMRIFEKDYFEMLDTCLERGIKTKQALTLAAHVYGFNAEIFDEMESHGLDAKTVALAAEQYPASVKKRLASYIQEGIPLQEKYPANSEDNRWIKTNTIYDVFMKYPETAAEGIAIVSENIDKFTKFMPEIPQSVMVDICASNPSGYYAQLERLYKDGKELMEQFEATPILGELPSDHLDSVSAESGQLSDEALLTYDEMGPDVSIFKALGVESLVYELLNKRDTNAQETLQTALGKFSEQLERADQEGVAMRTNTKRRILKNLVRSREVPAERIYKREVKLSNKLNADEQKRAEWFAKRADKLDPRWGEYYLYLGSGEDFNDRMEQGVIFVDLIREQYGDADGEDYLERFVDVVSKYERAGIKDEESLGHLKDSLLMQPNDPRTWFEKNLNQTWPNDLKEITLV